MKKERLIETVCSMKNPHRKVKIDYSLLCELLDLYRCAENCSLRVEYTSLYDTYYRTIDAKTIKKANNILENS